MNFDFPMILLSLVAFTGVVSLVDIIYSMVSKSRGGSGESAKSHSKIVEYCRSFFPVLLLVVLIRSFVVQPYRVPTGSLEPTVIPGDLILVSQYQYGLRLPVWETKIFNISEPKRGQITLFHYPGNHAITYVKRVIGVPGDRISYINKVLYINGKQMTQTPKGSVVNLNDYGQLINYKIAEENLDGVKHDIYMRDDVYSPNFYNLKVPAGHYFMMGDNRDGSDDSRFWGFVAEKDLIGRAMLIFMSWDSRASSWADKIRWDRIGNKFSKQ